MPVDVIYNDDGSIDEEVLHSNLRLITGDTSMIKGRVKKFGITNVVVRKNLGEAFYIFTKIGKRIHRIGTAKLSKDGRLCVDKLDMKKIESLT